MFEDFDSATYKLDHSREEPRICTITLVTGSSIPQGAVKCFTEDEKVHGVAQAGEPGTESQLTVKASSELACYVVTCIDGT